MESKQKENKVVLELTKEESIVLLDWLSRINEGENADLFQDQAEERVLWDMEASIEKVISETFESNYAEILSRAREKVRD
jgi:DNA primase